MLREPREMPSDPYGFLQRLPNRLGRMRNHIAHENHLAAFVELNNIDYSID